MCFYSYDAISLRSLIFLWFHQAEAECVMSLPSIVKIDYKFCLLEKQQQLNCFSYSSSTIQDIDGTELSVVNIVICV